DEVRTDSYDRDRGLPYGLLEAVEEFKQCESLRDVLGSGFSNLYAAVKLHEYEEFMQVISPWEREHLLLNV
ncbi:MAG: glutamine synthetase, partial [Pseudomonadota bacterium]